MESGDDKQKVLCEVGEQILTALGEVAQSAENGLARGSTGVSPSSLVIASNLMVGDPKPEKFIKAKNEQERAIFRKLMDEPFLARVDVDWSAEGRPVVETYYFPRLATGGIEIKGARFVSALADLGELAESETGDTVSIDVPGGTRTGRILKRVVFTPTTIVGFWDALVDDFGVVPWGDVLRLLQHRSLLLAIAAFAQEPAPVEDIVGQVMQEAATAAAELLRTRRKVIDRIALRDRPILDRFQGRIFRLPLDRQVILFGPPGSGKTTTLIRRLAQKRTPEALSEYDQELLTHYAPGTFERSDSWAMFSPGELLKHYLGAAFNLAGVPDADNVRTWERERLDLARNVLNILRSPNNTGRFQIEESSSFLSDPSSHGIAALHDNFDTYAEASLLRRCNEALAALARSGDNNVSRQASRLQRTLRGDRLQDCDQVLQLIDQATEQQAEIRRLGELIAAELRTAVNLLLGRNKSLLPELMEALPAIKAEEDEEADEDTEESDAVAPLPSDARMQALDVLMAALRNWARALAEGRRSPGGQSGRVIELIGARMPTERELMAIGQNIATRAHLRVLAQAPRTLVHRLPRTYASFRREALHDGRHFQASGDARSFVARNRITPDEVDVLLLVALRRARRIIRYCDQLPADATPRLEWLEGIKSRYLMQVFVDEATDLSAVQLACTVELADPNLRSWFASGDLRQRVTSHGLQDESEFAWLNHVTGVNLDIRRIGIGYRQSPRLRDLSDAIAGLFELGSQVKTQPPRGSEEDEADAWPLLGEGLSGDALAQWLADRIEEVEKAIGRLPSIAVFVDGEEHIDPLVNATHELLANIEIVGCKEGRDMGDEREVRVFDIQHIKGLEFEAVFFIGVDRLAERMPDLFLRFLYVGVTRAATYLALTCEERLPKELEAVREKFRNDGWAVIR